MADDGSPRAAGMRVEARMFAGIGAFLALATAVYAIAAYEWAGTVLLLLAAGMALLLAGYLTLQARRHAEPAAVGAGQPYLPHASVWPFGTGVGAVLMANGLALGLWAVIPGAALVGWSLWGYAAQSRRRD